MEKNCPPNTLFKYYSFKVAKEVLRSRVFRWMSPLEFNDPFDCQWDFTWQLWQPNVLELEFDLLKDFLASENPDWGKVAVRHDGLTVRTMYKARKDYRMCSLQGRYRYLHELRNAMRVVRESVKGKEIERQREKLANLRIFCLSNNPHSILMWSHYTRNHEGIVLELDVESVAKATPEALWVRVQYVDHFPKVYTDESVVRCAAFGHLPEWLPGANETTFFIEKKSAVWAYEEEWRAILEWTGTPSTHTDTEIPAGAVKSIILGCQFMRRHGTDGLQSIKALLDSWPHPKPKIRYASQSHESFQVSISK